MNGFLPAIELQLEDHEWPKTAITHHRPIARAIVFDDAGPERAFYFVRANRCDEFGRAELIETAGGGLEAGEQPESAVVREIREELGIHAEVLCKIGFVSDYYNLIHRHNLNHYYLCRALSFGENHLTREERDLYHLSMLKLSYDEALDEYQRCACTRLGRLIASRELPILQHAHRILTQKRCSR